MSVTSEIFGLALLGSGVVVLVAGFLIALRTGLPSGAELVASDTQQGRQQLLRDPVRKLSGKPDFILRRRSIPLLGPKRYVAVELKPSRTLHQLAPGDEMQVLVYILLLRAEYGRSAASYGFVRYKDKTFRVSLTARRLRELDAALAGIRSVRAGVPAQRVHRVAAKCASCGHRSTCPASLV